MAGLAKMTVETIGEMLGRSVSDIVVLVAKNVILSGSHEQVAQILGCSDSEVQEVMDSQDYKDVHLLLAAQYNHDNIATDLSYDEIEHEALKKIMKSIDREKDVDRLVRIATMANKAVRRQKVPTNPDVLDPGSAKGQVRLTLSRRIVDRLNQTQGIEREITEQISIHGGSTKPTFEEVSKFFDPRPDSQSDRFMDNQGEEITVDQIARALGNHS